MQPMALTPRRASFFAMKTEHGYTILVDEGMKIGKETGKQFELITANRNALQDYFRKNVRGDFLVQATEQQRLVEHLLNNFRIGDGYRGPLNPETILEGVTKTKSQLQKNHSSLSRQQVDMLVSVNQLVDDDFRPALESLIDTFVGDAIFDISIDLNKFSERLFSRIDDVAKDKTLNFKGSLIKSVQDHMNKLPDDLKMLSILDLDSQVKANLANVI